MPFFGGRVNRRRDPPAATGVGKKDRVVSCFTANSVALSAVWSGGGPSDLNNQKLSHWSKGRLANSPRFAGQTKPAPYGRVCLDFWTIHNQKWGFRSREPQDGQRRVSESSGGHGEGTARIFAQGVRGRITSGRDVRPRTSFLTDHDHLSRRVPSQETPKR